MKTKNSIQIVETPIIDKYELRARNGIINPAFLANSPVAEHYPLDDYRNNHFRPHWQPNGNESLASSWVYELNNGCSSHETDSTGANSVATNTTAMTTQSPHSRNSFHGIPYNGQHLSYDMDLNQEHSQQKVSGCRPGHCCRTLLRLFIWAVIVLSLLGIIISVAFIIYIEKFAVESCCPDPSLNTTGRHNISSGAEGLDGLQSTEYSISPFSTINPIPRSNTSPSNSTLFTSNTTSVGNESINSSTLSTTTSMTTLMTTLTTNEPKPVDESGGQKGGVTEQTTTITKPLVNNSATDGLDSRHLTTNNTSETVTTNTSSGITTAIDEITDNINDNPTIATFESIASTLSTGITTKSTPELKAITTTQLSVNIGSNNGVVSEESTSSSPIVTTNKAAEPTRPTSAQTTNTLNKLSTNDSNYLTNANSDQTANPINQMSVQALNVTTAESTGKAALEEDVDQESQAVITTTSTPITTTTTEETPTADSLFSAF